MGARDAYFNLLEYSAIAVGIGVVLEGLELAKDWREESQWLQRIRLPIPHVGRWILVAASIGWLLVAVGVFGEFWFEDKVSRYDHTIRDIDDDAGKLLSRQAADTQLVTAELNKRAEDEATARAGLEKEAALLRNRAAEAEDRLSYRRIESQQVTELATALKKFPSQVAEIVSYGSAYDTQLVVMGIEAALTQAGWSGHTMMPLASAGVHLGVILTPIKGAKDSVDQAADVILKTLTSWRIFCTRFPIPLENGGDKLGAITGDRSWGTKQAATIMNATIRIEVGDKPPFNTDAYFKRAGSQK
jgi:hypothetical protein